MKNRAGLITGSISVGVAAANAGAEGGSFFYNPNAHIVQTGAFAWLGGVAVSDANYHTNIPLIGGDIATGVTAVGLYNTECDSSKYGFGGSNPNLCPSY